MDVRLEFASGSAGNAAADWSAALDAATEQGGPDGEQAHAWLMDIVTHHFQETLLGKSPDALVDYVRSRQVWRRDSDADVIKTPDEPCVAYTLLERGNELVLLLLGFAFLYPTSEAAWWTDVIRPRLRQHT